MAILQLTSSHEINMFDLLLHGQKPLQFTLIVVLWTQL